MDSENTREVTLKHGNSLPFMIRAVIYSLFLGLPFFIFLALRVWSYSPEETTSNQGQHQSLGSDASLKKDIDKKIAELTRQSFNGKSELSDQEILKEIDRLKNLKDKLEEAIPSTESVDEIEAESEGNPWWIKYDSDFSKVLTWFAIFSCVLSFGALGAAVSLVSRSRDRTKFKDNVSLKELLSIQTIGAIFALILSLLFMGDMLGGTLFPGAEQFREIIYIEAAIAKLLIWSFIAGFFERFVPKILANLSKNADEQLESGISAQQGALPAVLPQRSQD